MPLVWRSPAARSSPTICGRSAWLVCKVATSVRGLARAVTGPGRCAAAARRAVEDFSPDCVGLGVRNIDNQDKYAGEFYPPAAREIADAVRSETSAPVVLGGAGFTIFPAECLEYMDVEMGIVGEGERSFVALLDDDRRARLLGDVRALLPHGELRVSHVAEVWITRRRG